MWLVLVRRKPKHNFTVAVVSGKILYNSGLAGKTGAKFAKLHLPIL